MNEVDNDDQGKEKINTTHLPPSPQSQSKPKTKIQTLAFIGILLIVGALASWFLLATNPKIISEKKPNPKKEIPKLTVINQGLKNEIYPSLVLSDYSYVFNFQIFEALVRYEDQTNIVPGLATSWTNQDECIEKRFPEGESYEDVKARVALFLEFLKKNNDGQSVAIVGHKAPQLSLDVLIKGKTWKQALAEDWRKTKFWQPGWGYVLP
jgi:hypothetical protein